MTLLEMSASYQDSASALHERILELRDLEKNLTNPEELFHVRHRINVLMPIWRETRDLAAVTAHYYDRSFHIYEQYTL